MTALDERVRTVKASYEDCFGCGRNNPIGLQLDGFSMDDDEVSASFTPRALYRGFEGVLHGGVLATALDEMLSWTAILVEGVFVVTGKLDLRFRNPAPVAGTFHLSGRIDDRRGRRLTISGECRRPDGEVAAEASGLFLVSREVGLAP
jgi:acyl-coenzyme A thioesterase PaaI-like protein